MRPSIESVSVSFVTVLANMRDHSELVGHGTGEVVDELSATNAVPEKWKWCLVSPYPVMLVKD